MTGMDIMDACWQVLKDGEEPHTFYPDQDMVKWVNEGIAQVTQRRPDSLIDADGVSIREIVPIEDLSDTLSISGRWFTALVEWVLVRAFQTDAEDEGDRAQAALHMKMFAEVIVR